VHDRSDEELARGVAIDVRHKLAFRRGALPFNCVER
jgi:hypothetical protein